MSMPCPWWSCSSCSTKTEEIRSFHLINLILHLITILFYFNCFWGFKSVSLGHYGNEVAWLNQCLAGRLCPIYGWQVTAWRVNCLIWVSQLGQFSSPSIVGRKMSRNQRNYMDYRGGDHQAADQAAYSYKSKAGRGLGLRPWLYAAPL